MEREGRREVERGGRGRAGGSGEGGHEGVEREGRREVERGGRGRAGGRGRGRA